MILRVLLLLFFASTAQAGVDALLEGPLPPEQEQAAIEQAVAEATPEDLARLFGPNHHTSTLVTGAEVLRRRLASGDLDVVPLAWATFLRSKHHGIPHHPDVFERLLLGLQQAGPDALPLLAGNEPPEFGAQAWDRLHDDLLSRVQPDSSWERPAIELSSRAWTEEQLAKDQPLVRLQTDSGDVAFRLFERLQVDALTAIVRDADEEHAVGALEAWAHRFNQWPTPVEAALARGLWEDVAVPAGPGEATMLRPRAQDSVKGGEGQYGLPTPTGQAGGAWWLLLAIPAWVLALRLRPTWRRALFPLGAVGVGFGLLVATEAGLAVAGVQPSLVNHADFFSYRSDPVSSSDRVFREVGDGWVTLDIGDARHKVFRREAEGPRIVVLGESSAHGSNHLAEETFAGRWDRDLRVGEQDVEVINAGIGGAISDEIVAIGLQSLDYDPDVLVFYFGFNDLSRLAYMAELDVFGPAMLRLQSLADRSRIFALLASVVPRGLFRSDEEPFEPPAPGQNDPAEFATMHALARAHLVRNMRRLITAAAEADVDVVIAIQALNEDHCDPTAAHPADPQTCVADHLRTAALDAAAGTHAVLVDVPAALRQEGGGRAGDRLFWDNIHPSRIGHRVIDSAVREPLRRALAERPD